VLVVGGVSLSKSATIFDLGTFGFGHSAKPTLVPPTIPRDTEGLLVRSLLEIAQGKTQTALNTLDEVLRMAPNFKLAHLVRGDLLMAHAREISGFGGASEASQEAISDFREEARVRLERYLSEQKVPLAPNALWQLDSSMQYVILVDTSKSRLYLYQNEQGKPRYLSDFYVTVGKNGTEKWKEGDKRTPLGVYFTGSQLPQKKLPDMYGLAAYPLSYPNEWDRHQGKNGHGIWLHGTPSDTYSRPPRASDGCVVMTNPDLKGLAPILQSGDVPVVIVNTVAMASADPIADNKEVLSQAIENWRQAWERQDTDHYLAFYSKDFFSPDRNYDSWVQEKRRIQASGTSAEISLSNFSMIRYPDDKRPMVVVSFDQRYQNNNLNQQMRKRQYWVLENGMWKILYEGAA
jgi:murein L,D-transpeptidase YafK